VAGVRSAAVVPLTAPDASVTGIALFYTLTAEAFAGSPEPAEDDPLAVHDRLAALLPDYLVPQVTRAVEDFPLTPNGKLDRTALARLARRRGRRRPGAVATADR
jgi:D-alanine--poly(phosphoribitol) ligase subunit 1